MNKNKLINAYTHLMEHLYEAMDDTLHSCAEAMDIAKEKLFKLLQDKEILSVAITEYGFGLSDLYNLTTDVNFLATITDIQYSKLWKLQKQWVKLKKFLRLY